jgi:hypothetical protein
MSDKFTGVVPPPTTIKRRKVIQLTSQPGTSLTHPMLFALCDDGTMWARATAGSNQQWEQLRDVDGEKPAPKSGNWINADDVDRLTRAIDVALNGEEGAAKRPKLCDIASQVESLARNNGPLLKIVDSLGFTIIDNPNLPPHVAVSVLRSTGEIMGYLDTSYVWHFVEGFNERWAQLWAKGVMK